MATVTLQSSTTQAAAGTGAAVDLQAGGAIQAQLARVSIVCTAASGTSPSLSLICETGPTETGPWLELGKIQGVSTASKLDRLMAPLDRWLRVRWTVKGTAPSFTFSADAVTSRLYCGLRDFDRLGLPAEATAQITEQALLTALLSASSQIDAHIPKRYMLPLTPPYPEILAEQAAKLASWTVLRVRGFDPESPADAVVKEGRDEAMDWLMKVAKGTIEPPWVDATPTVQEGAAVVVSDTLRGW